MALILLGHGVRKRENGASRPFNFGSNMSDG